MIIKEAVYEKIMVSQNRCVSDAVYGCDECGSKIEDWPNEPSRLEIKVFHHSDQTDSLHFCSWKCVFRHIPKINTDYFIDLPFVMFDSDTPNKKIIPKRSAQALIKLISKFKK